MHLSWICLLRRRNKTNNITNSIVGSTPNPLVSYLIGERRDCYSRKCGWIQGARDDEDSFLPLVFVFLKRLNHCPPQVHPAQRGRHGSVPRHHPQLLQGRARRLHLVLRLRADARETRSANDLSGNDVVARILFTSMWAFTQ